MISELTLESSDYEPARRFEVFTGFGRRREWLPEEKARIVAESYEAGETVSAVARGYALSPQQLFAWRRTARVPLAEAPASQSLFVPAMVTAPPPEPTSPTRPVRHENERREKPVSSSLRSRALRCGWVVAPTPKRSRR